MSFLLRLCCSLVILAPSLAHAAMLENPAPDSYQSGIGIISGWACDADRIEIQFNGGPLVEAAYGTSRGDTQSTCGDTDNGFGLLFNWNLLGNGTHTVRALADGVEFASVTVTVTTLGVEFLRGARGRYDISKFHPAGSPLELQWQEAQQNFVLTDGSGGGDGGGTSGSPPHILENPTHSSFQSGIGIISGWACDADRIEIQFNGGPPVEAGSGTSRGDTQSTCGDTDNGFGLLFNWNLLGNGTHTVRALADGVEFASVTVTVTTLGVEFVRGVSQGYRLLDFPSEEETADVNWQESKQNFVITAASPGSGGNGSGGSGSGGSGSGGSGSGGSGSGGDDSGSGGNSGGSDDLGQPWSEATMVQLSADTRGTLEQADDVNYYRLDIPDAGTVTVETTGNTDTIGQLRTGPTGTDPNGREVGRDDGAGAGTNFRISQPLPAGTYYILVNGRTTGDYTLRVRFTADPACDSDNVGDTPASAAILGLEQTVRESLECEGDIDYFVVRVPQDGILDVKTWDHEAHAWLDVAYSDDICGDGHICLSESTGKEPDGTHSTEEIAAGQYYIRIMSDRFFPEIGPYTLQIRLHPRQDDHGDDLKDATEIAVPSVTQGIIAAHDGPSFYTDIAGRIVAVFDPQATEVDIFYVDLDEYLNPQEGVFEGTLIIESEGDTDLVGKFIRGDGAEWEDSRGGEAARNIRIEVPLVGHALVNETWPYGWIAVAGHPNTVHHTGPYTLKLRIETDAPGVPRNVRVTEVGADYVNLDWDPPAEGGAASYNVYSRIEGGTETLLGSVTTPGVRITGITDSQESCYRIAAVSAAGAEGEKTAPVCHQGDGGREGFEEGNPFPGRYVIGDPAPSRQCGLDLHSLTPLEHTSLEECERNAAASDVLAEDWEEDWEEDERPSIPQVWWCYTGPDTSQDPNVYAHTPDIYAEVSICDCIWGVEQRPYRNWIEVLNQIEVWNQTSIPLFPTIHGCVLLTDVVTPEMCTDTHSNGVCQ